MSGGPTTGQNSHGRILPSEFNDDNKNKNIMNSIRISLIRPDFHPVRSRTGRVD
jgi:hypothetical protein